MELDFSSVFEIIQSRVSWVEYKIALLITKNKSESEQQELWSLGSSLFESDKYENSTNFQDCKEICYLNKLYSLNLTEYNLLNPGSQSADFSLFQSVTMRSEGNNILNPSLRWVITYFKYFDVMLIILAFCILWYVNMAMMSKLYYILFSQINLFTHKLNQYSKSMLKPNELTPLTIDDLLFIESNEISDFFLEFFDMFKKNRDNNFFDMTDSIERITSQLKTKMVFRKKFDEIIDENVGKIFQKNQTLIQQKLALSRLNLSSQASFD